MAGLTYSGKFTESLNMKFNPHNIAASAKQYQDFVKTNKHENVNFAKVAVPNPADWDESASKGFSHWDSHSGGIPKHLRDKVTEAVKHNLTSTKPLPMFYHVQTNIDHTHDVHIKHFVGKDGHTYLGIHVLCPNPHAPK